MLGQKVSNLATKSEAIMSEDIKNFIKETVESIVTEINRTNMELTTKHKRKQELRKRRHYIPWQVIRCST